MTKSPGPGWSCIAVAENGLETWEYSAPTDAPEHVEPLPVAPLPKSRRAVPNALAWQCATCGEVEITEGPFPLRWASIWVHFDKENSERDLCGECIDHLFCDSRRAVATEERRELLRLVDEWERKRARAREGRG